MDSAIVCCRPAMEQSRKARLAFEQQPDRSMAGLEAGAAHQDVADADSSGASSQDEDAPASRRSRQPKREQPRLPFAGASGLLWCAIFDCLAGSSAHAFKCWLASDLLSGGAEQITMVSVSGTFVRSKLCA